MAKRATYAMVEEADPQWCRFWEAYPKRVAKKEARKAWAALQPSVELVDRIVAALTWQCHQPAWTKDGGAFIPYPASWLNAERWSDERPTTMLTRAVSAAVSDPMRAWLEQKKGAGV